MSELRDKNLYYVGGVVRDEILNLPSFDTDYCFEGDAIDFAKKMKLEIIKENPDFGTVRVLSDNKEIDIASTREESYPKAGHLPKVENIGCPLEKDLKRRDFTINALAKNTVTGEIVDYFNGLDDIKKKELKLLHKNSFKDDPTRIIRGLKFSVRFGFELENETKKLQEEYLKNINYDMSYHRLKKELVETFNLNKQEAFDKFLKEKIYLLLGENQTIPKIKASVEDEVRKFNIKSPWIIYMGFFDLSALSLTRRQKKIVEWFSRLREQEATNNTPPESVIMYKLMYGEKC